MEVDTENGLHEVLAISGSYWKTSPLSSRSNDSLPNLGRTSLALYREWERELDSRRF